MRETSGTFDELQELFEIVVKFKHPEVKPKLQKLKGINAKLTQLLSSDQIAAALIQVMPNCSDFIQECWWQACSDVLTFEKSRKYPLHGYILGVQTHTTAWDLHWGGDELLK